MENESQSQMNSTSTTEFSQMQAPLNLAVGEDSDFHLYKEECFTIRYNEFSNQIAAGYSSGKISIEDLKSKTSKKYEKSDYPITCLRWKPNARTTLLLTTAGGFIIQVHTPTGKTLQSIEEEGNPLMCCDYSIDGFNFATGGNDKVVRLYDDLTKTMISKLESKKITLPQHSNRIFSVKFSPDDPNLLFSGGWDNSILLYDIRAKEVQNFLYGPHICGDSMDLKEDLLLTASCEKDNQIQIFDIRMLKQKAVFQMTIDGSNNNTLSNVSYLYSCRFNPVKSNFCVTGSNKNCLRIYDYKNLDNSVIPSERLKNIFEIIELKNPCYCCDYHLKGNEIVYGCGESKIYFQNLDYLNYDNK